MRSSVSLVRVGYAALCACTLLVAVGWPAWSRDLAIEYYGDYVDLAATIGGPPPVPAGTIAAFSVTIENQGPQRADWPWVLAVGYDGLLLDGSDGCAESPLLVARCTLPAGLDPGEVRSVAVEGPVDADARGVVALGIVAQSEAIDVDPGDELAFALVPIVVQHALSAAFPSFQPAPREDGWLVWTARVGNLGPSSARLPIVTLQAYSADGSAWPSTCVAVGAARCPGDPAGAFLAPGGELELAAALPPVSNRNPYNVLFVSVDSSEGGGPPSVDSILYGNYLLDDGFE